ncbi:MAG: diaminopimelate epimerase [Bacteriovoracaceae bacterium]|nr:diaminopimelate epimerase [Bacteriovoracaceae bacterium]
MAINNDKKYFEVCMQLPFEKIVASGNDFIAIDNRTQIVQAEDCRMWHKLCQTKTGIGADGVLLLENASTKDADFKMRYINADGGEVEMCGNGARAICYYAHLANNKQGTAEETYRLETMNGLYTAVVDGDFVKLHMTEINDIGKIDLKQLSYLPNTDYSLYLNTGVPHCVIGVKDLGNFDVGTLGRKIRYDQLFENGVNVNFFEIEQEGKIALRTYERGVEAETLSCGTGATAAAIAMQKLFGWSGVVDIKVKGGALKVELDDQLEAVYLCGSVHRVFSGTSYIL